MWGQRPHGEQRHVGGWLAGVVAADAQLAEEAALRVAADGRLVDADADRRHAAGGGAVGFDGRAEGAGSATWTP